MDLLDVLRQHHGTDDDERVIAHLAIRVFNAFAAAWKLSASGYYQVAASILRDVVETTNLASAFHVNRALVARWRTADRRTLKRDFSPAAVRKVLDEHAGRGKSRREEIYVKFCTLAAHPTVEGFAMLRPLGMDAHSVPFCDVTALRAVLEEAGSLATQAGLAFGVFLDHGQPPCSQVVHRFLVGAMDYSTSYLGKTYSAADRAELDRIFGPRHDQ